MYGVENEDLTLIDPRGCLNWKLPFIENRCPYTGRFSVVNIIGNEIKLLGTSSMVQDGSNRHRNVKGE